MDWVSHTGREFLAGLAREGIAVEVIDRVRQLCSNKQRAKGSHSVYRLADVGLTVSRLVADQCWKRGVSKLKARPDL